ncbi:hypothetical protein DAI22_08g159900 [Oryza sativa Japonica Group]|nr:hypothetical protein DAI22_08g159900 [Oryza sativa Japonica Group]
MDVSQPHVNEISTNELLKTLKRKLSKSKRSEDDNIKDKNVDTDLKSDAFSRFSVKYFSKVLDSLSPHHKTVIENSCFQSMLLFDKCFVPNSFALWIAKQVDVNCSDIVLGQKLIPLNKQSVHVVLGLPVGGSTIHSKFDSGKQKILQIFGKTSIPSVKFIGEKLIKNEEFPDDQILICFMIVSLNCFLCPNSSLIPGTKYLSAFEDMDLIESLDWCKLGFDWLMEHISKIEKSKTFGGCLFHLAVNYLDFLNFGSQKVLLDTPRIKVWKRSMIKDYSKFDKISEGVYGKRPVNDIASTCYQMVNNSSSSFADMLKSSVGDLLPSDVQDKICHLLSRNNQVFHDQPSFKIWGSDDDLHHENDDFKKEITTAHLADSYQVIPDSYSPNHVLRNKDSPDVVFIGEKKFSKKCADIGNKTNMMYNKMNRIMLDSQKQNFKTFASPERVLLCNMKNFNPSTSGTKPIHHDLRRVINPAKYCTDPYTPQRSNFTVSQYERQIYNAVCTLSTSRYQERHAVEIDGVHCKFSSFGGSFNFGHEVSNFVVSVFCRYLFHLSHPSKSKWFLFFPILYKRHWFVFIVHLKDEMFVFLDSLHEEGSEYQDEVKNRLTSNFALAWNSIMEEYQINFDAFKIVYPPVPRQNNLFDCGVFTLKYMELWGPRVQLTNHFSQKDIQNIRIQYVNRLFFYPDNSVLGTGTKKLVIDFAQVNFF